MSDAAAPLQSSGAPIAVGANPFSRIATLGIVLLGAALLLALLWMIGTGNGMGSTNDGQAHAGGKGINGYAALAGYLEERGFEVSRVRNERALDAPGLAILTPPANVDAKKLEYLVSARRRIGPTLIVVPKWAVQVASGPQDKDTPRGWVRLAGAAAADWPGFHDEISLVPSPRKTPVAPRGWVGAGLSAPLPEPGLVLGGEGEGLVPLVRTDDGKLVLAAYVNDGGDYPGLSALAVQAAPAGQGLSAPHKASVREGGGPVREQVRGQGMYPVVFIFEPDLLDNFGMAHFENARLAEALVRATGVAPGDAVAFDLTFNGLGRPQNLLTLAFTPPFLATTLCLLLAAAIVGWRAFLRFGPPLVPDRAIAFGKRALVANVAGLIRRTRRYHLLGLPYADRARDRLAFALALPRGLGPTQADQAIDRALAARTTDLPSFTDTAARLRSARTAPDLIRAARDLHALERMLTR